MKPRTRRQKHRFISHGVNNLKEVWENVFGVSLTYKNSNPEFSFFLFFFEISNSVDFVCFQMALEQIGVNSEENNLEQAFNGEFLFVFCFV
jgi:hypothetical protein